MHGMCRKQSGLHDSQLLVMNKMLLLVNKSNNKITELRTIFQRESQNSYVHISNGLKKTCFINFESDSELISQNWKLFVIAIHKFEHRL
jgi:hypothetical protein